MRIIIAWVGLTLAFVAEAATVRWCMDGEFDLGWRLQGHAPLAEEWVYRKVCVTAERFGSRVRMAVRGAANSDAAGDYEQSYPAADTVRVILEGERPDLEFKPVDVGAEAASIRRLVPRWLREEYEANPQWRIDGAPQGWQRVQYPGGAHPVDLKITGGRIDAARTRAELPLRGVVDVLWRWPLPGLVELRVDDRPIFQAQMSATAVAGATSARVWEPSGGREVISIPGEEWPARVGMDLETLDEGVYRMRSVRTGFHHLVVDTAKGLVVVDAPAGWVELMQLPPADLVPGLGISGLSERFVDALSEAFPGRPIRAVVLTHAHDDHAGGARAFAAAGATVYVPEADRAFLTLALNDKRLPPDRFSTSGRKMKIVGVSGRLRIDDVQRPLELIVLDGLPHARANLIVHLPRQGLLAHSDLSSLSPEAAAPEPRRALAECGFARVVADLLPGRGKVYSTHAVAPTPRESFLRWRDAVVCNAGAEG